MQPGIYESSEPFTVREVLENSMVRQRIIEYLGARRLEDTTSLFLGRVDAGNPSHIERHPPSKLHVLLDEGCELARSLADRRSMLIHLDIEYVNFDNPALALLDPQRAFHLQEGLVRVIETRLLSFGIHPLHLVTGQGHHFVWKIRKASALAKMIASLAIYTSPAGQCVNDPLFAHVALLMEYLAHLLKPDAAAGCELPVEITAQHVGPGHSGQREMLSIDLSEYGDPLATRMIRIPFTVYRKPWLSGLIDRLGIHQQVPKFFTLPLYEMSIADLIEQRHHPAMVIDLAHRAAVEIPLEESGTRNLLAAYLDSRLSEFHRRFYASDDEDGPSGEARRDLASMAIPPCARHIIEHPNDLLLKPSGIQLITRVMLANGWQPRQIATWIASEFSNPDHHWGCQWDEYDPTLRAEFYVRLFAGQIDQAIDSGVDFNCRSQQEKNFCWNPNDCSLDPFRARVYHYNKPDLPP